MISEHNASFFSCAMQSLFISFILHPSWAWIAFKHVTGKSNCKRHLALLNLVYFQAKEGCFATNLKVITINQAQKINSCLGSYQSWNYKLSHLGHQLGAFAQLQRSVNSITVSISAQLYSAWGLQQSPPNHLLSSKISLLQDKQKRLCFFVAQ